MIVTDRRLSAWHNLNARRWKSNRAIVFQRTGMQRRYQPARAHLVGSQVGEGRSRIADRSKVAKHSLGNGPHGPDRNISARNQRRPQTHSLHRLSGTWIYAGHDRRRTIVDHLLRELIAGLSRHRNELDRTGTGQRHDQRRRMTAEEGRRIDLSAA